MCSNMHNYMHTCIQTHIHEYICVYVYVCVHMCVCVCVCVCLYYGLYYTLVLSKRWHNWDQRIEHCRKLYKPTVHKQERTMSVLKSHYHILYHLNLVHPHIKHTQISPSHYILTCQHIKLNNSVKFLAALTSCWALIDLIKACWASENFSTPE